MFNSDLCVCLSCRITKHESKLTAYRNGDNSCKQTELAPLVGFCTV